MTSTADKPFRPLQWLLVTSFYLAITVAVLRGVAPAMISSDSTPLVLIGFLLLAIWLISSICLANHLINKRRVPAATNEEEVQ